MIATNGSGEIVIVPANIRRIAPGSHDGGCVLPRSRLALGSTGRLPPTLIRHRPGWPSLRTCQLAITDPYTVQTFCFERVVLLSNA